MIKDGIIIVNKPQDWTSHDVVNVLRRISGQRKAGHTGTLDPMATGVLPVCFGSATRIMEYLDLDIKKYKTTLKLGCRTDTLDIWGEILNEEPYGKITKEDIFDAFEKFKGNIKQIPPKYSAIKVRGRKLYEYARKGEEVEIKPRNVYIKNITVEDISLEKGEIIFTVECSKGTYIRSLCRDIGEELGCGGTMYALQRLSSGVFDIKNSVDIEELREKTPKEIEDFLYPVDYPLVHFGKACVDKTAGEWFKNGGKLQLKRVKIEKEPKDLMKNDTIREEYKTMYNIYEELEDKQIFLGTGYYDEGEKIIKPHKVFTR